jgi:CubicO group peptidase (beta-lactamase class C family)
MKFRLSTMLFVARFARATRWLVASLVAGVFAAAAVAEDYFPPPESRGGWRKLTQEDELRRIGGVDPAKLRALREWLLAWDQRDFAAVVIRRGHIVLEVERGNSAVTDTRNIKSCAKAVCATVLAIAAEESRAGALPRRMSFDDRALDFIPWAQPLSDPRKAEITVRQLLNHTSGLTPESTGHRNTGPWELALGLTGNDKTARLAFAPGTDWDYTTHGFYHAALVCETVTGRPYDEYATERLLRPLGIERSWFEFFDGRAGIGRHPTHALGLPARESARIAWCLLKGGRWAERQVVPAWFVAETAAPSHAITGVKAAGRVAESFSHGWELPARRGELGRGVPADARFKPGSGGQLIAWVPSLELVVTRQTGGSGAWEYEECLRRACATVLASADSKAQSPR